MALARLVSALLIALSVALAPIAGTAAPAQIAMPMSDDATSMSGGGHDCCPDATQPCDMSKDGCMSMAMCVSAAVFSAPSVLDVALPVVASQSLALPFSNALHSRTSGPPLRPPQI
jgi:hypothetical protein